MDHGEAISMIFDPVRLFKHPLRPSPARPGLSDVLDPALLKSDMILQIFERGSNIYRERFIPGISNALDPVLACIDAASKALDRRGR
jgi:hypothetical protein